MTDNAPVYLDYNATAPVKPAVAEVVADALLATGNPSSVHSFGRDARRRVEDAREQVAGLIECAPEDVVFTAGGTEANNTALRGAGRPVIITSAIEHPSVLRTAEALAETVVLVPVDEQGVIDSSVLDVALAEHGPNALVSIMLANNETGVIQPISTIAERAHAHGALIHCDAVQAPGRIPLSFEALGVDLMSLSAHKFAGPKGVGALVLGGSCEVEPLIHGGGQERGRRGGTENAAGIVGFGKAAELAKDDLAQADEIAALRDRLEARLRETEPEIHVFSASADRLPNTSCVTMPGVQSETQVMGLDLAGAAVSAGSACSSGKVEPSHVLRALGAPDGVAGCAIRVSLGWATTERDIDRFLKAWRALYAGLTNRWKAGLSAAATS
jgi:cysteine desulfurase